MQQKILGEVVIRNHTSQHYKTIFSQKTGFFVRVEDDEYKEPFWSNDGPELLDLSITNYCQRCCDFCYRQSNPLGKHMQLSNIENIVKQAKEVGVLQIALGGGNPNQHPDFIEILRLIRVNGIVPSYTSNGEGLTNEILEATKKYCGAMALSLYNPYNRYEDIIYRITDYGIKLNIHVILKRDTIEWLTSWLNDRPLWFNKVNAIIVLNYKPIGGSEDLMVRNSKQLKKFYKSVAACKSVKIGFDSCCVPGIVKWMDINPALVDSREAARFSAFISEDMKMFPCSFMANTRQYGDLRQQSMLKILQSHPAFIKHRQAVLHNTCSGCTHQSICNGGCVFMPYINQCGRR